MIKYFVIDGGLIYCNTKIEIEPISFPTYNGRTTLFDSEQECINAINECQMPESNYIILTVYSNEKS